MFFTVFSQSDVTATIQGQYLFEGGIYSFGILWITLIKYYRIRMKVAKA